MGTDYDLSEREAEYEITFGAGQIYHNVSLSLIDDIFPEENETFEILLTASPGVFLSPHTQMVVTIIDNDPDFPGKL